MRNGGDTPGIPQLCQSLIGMLGRIGKYVSLFSFLFSGHVEARRRLFKALYHRVYLANIGSTASMDTPDVSVSSFRILHNI